MLSAQQLQQLVGRGHWPLADKPLADVCGGLPVHQSTVRQQCHRLSRLGIAWRRLREYYSRLEAAADGLPQRDGGRIAGGSDNRDLVQRADEVVERGEQA